MALPSVGRAPVDQFARPARLGRLDSYALRGAAGGGGRRGGLGLTRRHLEQGGAAGDRSLAHRVAGAVRGGHDVTRVAAVQELRARAREQATLWQAAALASVRTTLAAIDPDDDRLAGVAVVLQVAALARGADPGTHRHSAASTSWAEVTAQALTMLERAIDADPADMIDRLVTDLSTRVVRVLTTERDGRLAEVDKLGTNPDHVERIRAAARMRRRHARDGQRLVTARHAARAQDGRRDPTRRAAVTADQSDGSAQSTGCGRRSPREGRGSTTRSSPRRRWSANGLREPAQAVGRAHDRRPRRRDRVGQVVAVQRAHRARPRRDRCQTAHHVVGDRLCVGPRRCRRRARLARYPAAAPGRRVRACWTLRHETASWKAWYSSTCPTTTRPRCRTTSRSTGSSASPT